MDALNLAISRANSLRDLEAQRNLAESRKVMKVDLRKIDIRKPFVAHLSSVGAEFHPPQLLKPVILKPSIAARCTMPDRSFGGPSMRIDTILREFPDFKYNENTVVPRFLKTMEKAEAQRMQYMSPKPLKRIPAMKTRPNFCLGASVPRCLADAFPLETQIIKSKVANRRQGFI